MKVENHNYLHHADVDLEYHNHLHHTDDDLEYHMPFRHNKEINKNFKVKKEY